MRKSARLDESWPVENDDGRIFHDLPQARAGNFVLFWTKKPIAMFVWDRV